MKTIRELRKEKGITLKQLGEIIGVAESTMSLYETGKRTPDFEALLKISEYFGVTVDYLLGNKIQAKEKTPAPGLTAKDESDIQKQLEKTLQQLEGEQGALMFDGKPMDDITKELLIASLRNSMEIGKRLAKEKFTPKKYRK